MKTVATITAVTIAIASLIYLYNLTTQHQLETCLKIQQQTNHQMKCEEKTP